MKPEERKTCHNVYNCELPQNCKEVKKLNSASVDGEYFLAVRGKPLKVFCAGMRSDYPKEYVTLAMVTQRTSPKFTGTDCTTQQNVPITGADGMTAIAGRITQLLASPVSRKSELT